jgi:hypothetical protein
VCGRGPNEVGHLLGELVYKGLYGDLGKGKKIPLLMVVDLYCAGQVERARVLPTHVHIM